MAFPDLSTYGGFQAAIGFAGQIANMNPVATENMTNESVGLIDFGIAVAYGTVQNDIQKRTCKLVTTALESTDIIAGITLRHLAYGGALRTPIGVNGVVGYPTGDAVPIAREGDIFVVAFENVTFGTQALSITAQGGRIASTTGGAAATGRVVIPGATWLTTTLAGAVGIVRLNS